MKPLADDRNEDVDRHGDPYLGFDGILAGAEKCFHAQMLFDPSKEKFDLPSGLVQVADGECRQGCIVREEQQSPQALWIFVANPAQGFRIGLRGIETLEHEHLIENESGGSVDRV